MKGGGARLGLALAATADARLEARKSESWSERLTASLTFGNPEDVDAGLAGLLRVAWERS